MSTSETVTGKSTQEEQETSTFPSSKKKTSSKCQVWPRKSDFVCDYSQDDLRMGNFKFVDETGRISATLVIVYLFVVLVFAVDGGGNIGGVAIDVVGFQICG